MGGVSTISDYIDSINDLGKGLEEDAKMRLAIVDAMREATLNQMGVYVSAWKYSPCLPSSTTARFESILHNEVESCSVSNKHPTHSTTPIKTRPRLKVLKAPHVHEYVQYDEQQ